MKLAVMQPYFFPYIGYFQLIGAVDRFVIYDDVQWVNRGWINRNRILLNGKPSYITLPLKKGSSRININERLFAPEIEKSKEKILKTIQQAYINAPCINDVVPLLERCLSVKTYNVLEFVVYSLRECCDYLGLSTSFVLSSELGIDDELRSQERMLEINKTMGATDYINAAGGAGLYDKELFARNGIRLHYLRTGRFEYQQFGSEFVPALSIIDVIMFNTRDEVARLLEEYTLG